MKMHFPISITEKTPCSQGDLHHYCFLILSLFLLLATYVCFIDRLLINPFIFIIHLSCFWISYLPVKAKQTSCIMQAIEGSECPKYLDESPWVFLMFQSVYFTNPSQDPCFNSQRDANWINVNLLCELNISAAACLTVVLIKTKAIIALLFETQDLNPCSITQGFNLRVFSCPGTTWGHLNAKQHQKKAWWVLQLIFTWTSL